jgi:coenzyme F420-reducing hydrogenase beta subunit
MNNRDGLNQKIEKLLQEHPEIAEALELFNMEMKEYAEVYKFLNEPEIITSDGTNEFINKG